MTFDRVLRIRTFCACGRDVVFVVGWLGDRPVSWFCDAEDGGEITHCVCGCLLVQRGEYGAKRAAA